MKLLALSVALAASLCTCDASLASVTYTEDHKFHVQDGVAENWVAKANLTRKYYETGWDFLEVETNGDYPDNDQAYAAGLVEAYLTKDLVVMHWNNTVSGYCQWQGQEMCDKLNDYVATNEQWVNSMVEQNAASDPYWHQVGLVYQQLNGLIDGVDLTPSIPGDPGVKWLNIAGDLEDLEVALTTPANRPKHLKASWGSRTLGSGHCSALIKVLPGGEDLYTAQVTWSSFQSMMRIQKRYVFNYGQTDGPDKVAIPGRVSTFSSYPGILSSQDDFSILSSGLVTQETTIGNSNNDLWKFVQPEGQVLEWIRAVVANNLATSGEEWTDVFGRHNSGTYNNQWMVVDYKRFKSGDTALRPGLLWILEQIPGTVMAEDVTGVLQSQQYWPSYNSPYFPEIFNLSGNPELVDEYGDWFSYDMTPRARIFRRDQDGVTDVGSMMKLMRYNDYKNDPLSACDCEPPYSGENAISARCDLNPANGTYPFSALGHRDHGGTDMKLTTTKLVPVMEFISIAGPTYDQQPPFQWSKADFVDTTPHWGHPDLFQFDPIQWNFQWQ
ncbi:putative phospholipase B-like 2 [Amphibalanus amphitrite]|uniref:putative phospholipase B-like 2 n=1 Tax=Amphibalanus amphitrite TaxID=1232801 RepID=UPI001C921E29|nr:putative phospholipase B-like 2 [Amphibalanus amphitrite]XP_043199590.1 putative phospholipase B-like 2 [Amphibalanus amphitrite]